MLPVRYTPGKISRVPERSQLVVRFSDSGMQLYPRLIDDVRKFLVRITNGIFLGNYVNA